MYDNGRPLVTIYTDGSCDSTSGYGGWAAILISLDPTYIKEISGSESNTTNNRMELQAFISALEQLTESSSVKLYSDSKYVAQGTGFVHFWKRNNWKKKDGGEVSNHDLWERYLDVIFKYHHKIRSNWVKGHSDNEFNNRCDQMAVRARKDLQYGLH